MNRSFEGIKAVNIRDYKDSPQDRQAMGYFKHTANKMKISQAELLRMLQTQSLEDINLNWMAEQGMVVEFKPKPVEFTKLEEQAILFAMGAYPDPKEELKVLEHTPYGAPYIKRYIERNILRKLGR